MFIAHIYPLIGGVWPIQKFSWGHLGIIIPPPALDLWKNRDKLYWNAQVVDEIGGAVDWLAQVGSQWLKLVASNRQKTINQQGQSGLPLPMWRILSWSGKMTTVLHISINITNRGSQPAQNFDVLPQKQGFFVPFWRIWLSKPPDSSHGITGFDPSLYFRNASMPSLCCWGCPSPWVPKRRLILRDHQTGIINRLE